MIARDGKIITRWSSRRSLWRSRTACLATAGVLLFSNDWTFQVWDDAG